MKKIALSLFSLVLVLSATAQFSVRLYNYRPTGDYGAVFKPTISAEIGTMRKFNEDRRVRGVFTGTVLYLRPRMSELPVTGEMEDGSGVKVFPGTINYQLYLALQAHLGIDVALYRKNKFNAFIGTSAILGAAFVHYHSLIPGFEDEEGFVGGLQLGVQGRIGAEYQLTDNLGLFASANRNFCLMISKDVGGLLWANDYGIGVSYKF